MPAGNDAGMRKKSKTLTSGTFIRQWRKYRGLSQEQLAEKCGWVVSNVSQLERGQQGYSQPGLELIAKALDCTVADPLSIDPTRGDPIYKAWDKATPSQRDLIVDMANTIVNQRH